MPNGLPDHHTDSDFGQDTPSSAEVMVLLRTMTPLCDTLGAGTPLITFLSISGNWRIFHGEYPIKICAYLLNLQPTLSSS